MQWVKKHWFVAGIALAVGGGIVFAPQVTSIPHLSVLSSALVVVMFLNLGRTLPIASLKRGVTQWKTHLLLQVLIFPIPVLYALLSAPYGVGEGNQALLIGTIALFALPTTVSSCAVFTLQADGDVTIAVVNAALSNILGVIVTPLLLFAALLVLHIEPHGTASLDFTRTVLRLSYRVLLPFAVGVARNHTAGEASSTMRQRLAVVNNVAILVIVCISLSGAAQHAVFDAPLIRYLRPTSYLALSHLLLVGVAYGAGIITKCDRAQRIAILYTASQKTLAMGVPLLTSIFAAGEGTMEVLLPIVFYHPFQLVVASTLVASLSRTITTNEKESV